MDDETRAELKALRRVSDELVKTVSKARTDIVVLTLVLGDLIGHLAASALDPPAMLKAMLRDMEIGTAKAEARNPESAIREEMIEISAKLRAKAERTVALIKNGAPRLPDEER